MSHAVRNLVILFCLLCGLGSTLLAQDRELFIGELEAQPESFVGRKLRVEGRTTAVDRTQVKFKGSRIYFYSRSPLPVIGKKSPNLAVSGVVRQQEGRWTFEMSRIDERPADLDQLQKLRGRIRRDVPADWYQLAKWCRERGTFYQDSSLLDQDRELSKQGFELEWKQLPPDDFNSRFQLAGRARDLQIAESSRSELVHEAYQLQRAQYAKLTDPDWSKLAGDLRRDLTGTEVPLKECPEAWRNRYLADPRTTYHQAPPEERLKLHRLLWLEVRLGEILSRLKPDQSNTADIAGEIELNLPELRFEADRLRQQGVSLRGKNLDQLKRTELIELREEYLRRKQEAQGEALVDRWLAQRKKKIAPDDLEGILQLIRDYEVLGRNPQEFGPQLLKTLETFPDSTEITTALQKLGYQKVQGKWLSREERKQLEEPGETGESVNRSITLGMTASQLRKALGKPASLTRIASKDQLQEIWVYQLAQKQVTLFLTRTVSDREPKVIAIDDLAPQSSP